MPSIDEFITHMPKVELHVHLEGSVLPETLLTLAKRHHRDLPAKDLAGLREWYRFRNFDHFIEIYMAISSCLRTAEDIELIAREFLQGQAGQNIRYSEVTFTPYSQFINCGLGFHEQIDAVNRARAWAEAELGVRMNLIVDIPRQVEPAAGLLVAEWVNKRYGDGIIALGLGGPEIGHPVEKFQAAFDLVRKAGIPRILHAGETDGPESIWSALNLAGSRRIGHGVRAVEDPALMDHLREHQIPLEVCPTSNLCLKVYPDLACHSLPKLLEEGLYITLNSDDPPMFNTTLTNEYLKCRQAFGWDFKTVRKLSLNAIRAALIPEAEKEALLADFESGYDK
ncbi:MAG: adenosine deaminase [Anaerolineaceae bacterium]